jgi:hypothetical protein
MAAQSTPWGSCLWIPGPHLGAGRSPASERKFHLQPEVLDQRARSSGPEDKKPRPTGPTGTEHPDFLPLLPRGPPLNVTLQPCPLGLHMAQT